MRHLLVTIVCAALALAPKAAIPAHAAPSAKALNLRLSDLPAGFTTDIDETSPPKGLFLSESRRVFLINAQGRKQPWAPSMYYAASYVAIVKTGSITATGWSNDRAEVDAEAAQQVEAVPVVNSCSAGANSAGTNCFEATYVYLDTGPHGVQGTVLEFYRGQTFVIVTVHSLIGKGSQITALHLAKLIDARIKAAH